MLMESIFNSTLDAIIVITDEDQRILLFNHAAESMFKCPASEAIGQPLDRFMPPEARAKHAQYVRAFGEAGITKRTMKASTLDLTCLRADGEAFPAEVSISQFEIGGQKRFAAIIRDISESVRLKNALHESEQRFRRLAEATFEGIIIHIQGTILDTNSNAAEIFGYAAEEFIGMSLADLFTPESRSQVMYYEDNDLETIYEATAQRKNKSVFACELHGKNVSYQGRSVRMLALRDVSERKKVENILNRRLLELETLHQSGLAFSQSLNPKEIAEKAIEVLDRHLNWHHAAVRLRPQGSDEIELLAFSQSSGKEQVPPQIQSRITRIGEGMVGWVIEHGQVLRSGNVNNDPRYVETFAGMKSGLYAPMKIREKTIGCISVESDETNAFTEEDERLVATLAAQAAIAIENARLFEQLNLRLEQVSGLHAIDMAISSATDLSVILEIVIDRIVTLLNVDAAGIYLYEPALQKLELKKSIGFRTSDGWGLSVRLGEDLIGRTALERKVIYALNNLAERVAPGRRKFIEREQFQNSICVPLIAKHQVKGVLEVLHRSPLKLDTDWKDFLQVLAGQTAIAIDNAQLFDNLQRTNLELAVSYDATIEGWSRAMSLRDLETEEHIQRVSELCLQLAERMGINREQLVHIRRGALLHDIGKIGIPDAVLLKPDKLTEEEWQIVRKHPQYAHDILVNIPYLRPAIDIPYCHHEKWDGSGYPRGLKAEQIPFAARIFAVVDVFDALTSHRPYRAPLPKEQALEYIREQAGKHFDPQVVDAFLKRMADLQ